MMPSKKCDVSDIVCPKCNQIFTWKKNLYVHMRKIHQLVGENDPIANKKKCCSELCSICGKSFVNKINLQRHMKTIHGTKMLPNRKQRIQCPCCEERLNNYNVFRNHLNEEHNIDIIKEEHKFISEEEFQHWKEKLELETTSHYVLDSSPTKLSNKKTKRYYNCHRSHEYRSCGQNIRSQKGVVSNKIGKACPSRIEVLIQDNYYCVHFWKTHVGHSDSVRRTFLSKEFRAKIADKLKKGVTFQHILDEIRDSTSASDAQSRQLPQLKRKDLHNIVRDFNIQYSTKRHVDDAANLKLWVEDMRTLNNECPVLYFKEQGIEDEGCLLKDDFCLIIMTNFQCNFLKKFGRSKICVDGIYGTSSYNIHSYTLMTIDKVSSGCPVAFCVTNRTDELIFKIFFEHIASKTGLIDAVVFMSDDVPAYYNAWSTVMSSLPNKLLCSWDVNKKWRQNLSKIIGGTPAKALVYKTIRSLQETSREKFLTHANQVLKDLFSNPNTSQFGHFFQTHFMNRPKEWAHCYRDELEIKTHIHLESLHHILKHIHLEGKKAESLHKTIEALMSLSRDNMFKHLIKLTKNNLTDHLNAIKISHKASYTILDTMIEAFEDKNEWLVDSTTHPLKKYLVSRLEKSCIDCPIKCHECDICSHDFKCSCIDNLIRLNICKHIHACARYTVSTEVDEVINIVIYDDNPFDELTENQVIKRKSEVITGLCSQPLNLSDDEYNQVKKNLDQYFTESAFPRNPIYGFPNIFFPRQNTFQFLGETKHSP